MKKILFTLLSCFAFLALTAQSGLAGVASPSLSRIIGSDNFATEGLKEEGTDMSAYSRSLDYSGTAANVNGVAINSRWKEFFLGFDYQDVDGASYISSYKAGYAMDNLSLAVTMASAASGATTTSTTAGGLAWRLGSLHLGFAMGMDDATTSSTTTQYGVGFLIPEAFRAEYSSSTVDNGATTTNNSLTELEGQFGDFILGYTMNDNGTYTANDMYIGWQMPKMGASVVLRSVTSENPTFTSGTQVDVGWSF